MKYCSGVLIWGAIISYLVLLGVLGYLFLDESNCINKNIIYFYYNDYYFGIILFRNLSFYFFNIKNLF